MPYIRADERKSIDERLEPIINNVCVETAGGLNYIITRIVDAWLNGYGSTSPPSYTAYNAAMGALECAKLELYARVIRPYENEKMTINGDVYSVRADFKPLSAIELIEIDGKLARWDKAKGVLIDPPFGEWPREKDESK
jgi:hypothetical protein